jgi:hypothetical protein
MNEYTDIMNKATLSQITDFIKNGELSDIDVLLEHEQDSFRSLSKLEDIINSRLKQEDAESLIDEVNNCMFRIENIAFQNGVRVGAKLLRQLLQI